MLLPRIQSLIKNQCSLLYGEQFLAATRKLVDITYGTLCKGGMVGWKDKRYSGQRHKKEKSPQKSYPRSDMCNTSHIIAY